ncbi:MAG TPA: response regulator transcription factor [Ruminiclostridium sp.]|nr:response regulator transcription factor [Ruminiclostridium sp.]
MNSYDILLVDDDKDLSEITCDVLRNYDYTVLIAGDSTSAYMQMEHNSFHMIILDINLPGDNGFDICSELRRVSMIPVMFISARTSEDDRVTGLDIGGDDYLPKPYSSRELLAHVNALMRRTYGAFGKDSPMRIGSMEIDPSARSVTKGGKEIPLSMREFDLLLYMVRNQGKALSKTVLLNNVWGIMNNTEESTVTVHIRWLREKLEDDPASPEYIKTIRGVGYCIGNGNE